MGAWLWFVTPPTGALNHRQIGLSPRSFNTCHTLLSPPPAGFAMEDMEAAAGLGAKCKVGLASRAVGEASHRHLAPSRPVLSPHHARPAEMCVRRLSSTLPSRRWLSTPWSSLGGCSCRWRAAAAPQPTSCFRAAQRPGWSPCTNGLCTACLLRPASSSLWKPPHLGVCNYTVRVRFKHVVKQHGQQDKQ